MLRGRLQERQSVGRREVVSLRESTSMKDSYQTINSALNASENVSYVYVVDDDDSVRDSLHFLLTSLGMKVAAFPTAVGFLEFQRPIAPSCLILDVRMPEIDGLELQRRLRAVGDAIPIIFATAYGDIPMAVEAMKSGARDFLAKPFRDQDILEATWEALRQDRRRLKGEHARTGLRSCYMSLSDRERDILSHVVNGLMNKQIAAAMNLSVITIKTSRAQAMKKMQCRTLAEFIRKGHMLGLGSRSWAYVDAAPECVCADSGSIGAGTAPGTTLGESHVLGTIRG
jgi:FixJ family two-component response regulator